ncbi:hypothetical protein [uncultured Nocardioides sp.]|uniref:hypothetical protein n=1 Tax=uncultured Nocardioides sp. TaxID=198441 RepID=UPI00260D88E1|nr:hypothetical protein [uncultured Nocardioides sp.]HRD59394.1 hypothetical protein [Nocardioides sp.]
MSVITRGIDTSARAILASDYMWSWWLNVVDDLGWTPTIVQGAWMSRVPGGGAKDSAGYHDKGGCFDLRTWDLTPTRLDQLVRVLREHGAAAWRRDQTHGGMDPHLHFVLGTDADLAPGAAQQWRDYQAGLDGLASRGKDYEWRPNPLVLKPPEDDMPYTKDELIAIVRAAVKAELAEGKPQGSDLTRDELDKRTYKASVEARDMLKAKK